MLSVNKTFLRMRVSWSMVCAMLLLLCSAALPVSSAAPQATTIVRTDPPIAKAPVGGSVTVKIYIADVVGMNAADVRLVFDPQLLQIVDADPAAAGTQITPLDTFLKPDYVARKIECDPSNPANPDCSGGKGLIWYAVTQVHPHPPVSGSGPIASITFRRLKEGDATLTWKYIKVVDKNGASLQAQGVDGLVLTGAAPLRTFLPLTLR